MHIYINEELEKKLKRLANSGLYKKNSVSYVVKYLVEKEEKYTAVSIEKLEEHKAKEQELIKKFGSINNVIDIAKEDWVNVNE